MFENLEWRLIAKDEASETMKKVEKAQQSLTDQTEKASKATQSAGQSWKSIATGVFAGGLAFEVAKKSIGAAKDAIVGLVQAGLDQEASMARVASTVNSVGISYESVKGQLSEFSDSMVGLGFNANDAEESMAKLIASTRDVEQAQKLGALAADLAADKGLTLAEATRVLNQVVTGNTKVLKEYGLKMQEGASSAEVLAEVQTMVGGRAKDMADTVQGSINIMKERWSSLKDQIGLTLIPTIRILTGQVTENSDALKLSDEQVKTWQLRIYQTAVIIKGVILTIGNFIQSVFALGKAVFENGKFVFNVFKDIGQGVANLGDGFKTLFKALKQGLTGDFSGALDTIKDGIKNTFSGSINAFKDYQGAVSNLANEVLTAMDPMEQAINDATQHKSFDEMVRKMNDASKAAKTAGSDFKNAFAGIGQEADGSGANKLKENIEKIKADYKELADKVAENLEKLEQDHKEKVDNITAKLKDLKAQLKEVEAAYKATIGDMNKSEAEKAVEQEQKVAELKKRLAEEMSTAGANQQGAGVDQNRITELQSEIAKEEQALTAYMERRKGLEVELTEARRRANLTDFERFIEDINIRRTETEAEFTKKKEQLQAEIVQQEEAATKEQAIYEAKKLQYLDTQQVFQEFHDKYILNLGSMKNETQVTVDLMNKKLKEMIAILQAIESVRNKAGVTAQAVANEIARDVATKNGGGSTENNSTININMGGVNVNNKNDADNLVQNLIRQLQLTGLGSH